MPDPSIPCPYCGGVHDSRAKFCPVLGQPLSPASTAQEAEQPPEPELAADQAPQTEPELEADQAPEPTGAPQQESEPSEQALPEPGLPAEPPQSCPHCGQVHPPGVVFCPATGKPIATEEILHPEQICPNCGRSVQAGWIFCPTCQASLAPGMKPAVKTQSQRRWMIASLALVACLVLLVAGVWWIWQNRQGLSGQASSLLDRLPIARGAEASATPLPSQAVAQAPLATLVPATPTPTITLTPPPTPTVTTSPTVTHTLAPTWTSLPPVTATPTQVYTLVPVTPCISYYDETNGNLKFACQLARHSWTVETVDSTENVGLYTSLAFDSRGEPHISYFDKSNGILKYAHKSTAGWDIERVDESGSAGWYSSLALGGDDQPWIAYYVASSRQIRLVHRQEMTWQALEVVTLAKEAPDQMRISLKLDRQGKPLLAFYDPQDGHLKLAAWDGIQWKIEAVDNSPRVGGFCSLALDKGGNPGLSYFDLSKAYLKYAHKVNGQWNIELIDAAGEVGKYTSLAFDSQGLPHISYFDEDRDDLRYAHWNGKSWNAAKWVDTYTRTGTYTSIALDKEDRPYIAYYSLDARALRVVAWTGYAWDPWTVDQAGKVGLYPSIAFQYERLVPSGSPGGE